MRAKEVLVEVRQLLGNKENWTQGVMARDIEGGGVSAWSNEAVCWCLAGALSYVTRFDVPDIRPMAAVALAVAIKALGKPIYETYPTDIVISFNDGTWHVEVLEVLDKAIASWTSQRLSPRDCPKPICFGWR